MTIHSYSHKHVMGTPPPKSEEVLRDIIAGVFKKQKSEVIGRLATLMKNPKKASVGDEWNEAIVKATRPVVMAIYKVGGDKALKSIRKFPKKSGKKGYTHEEVDGSEVVEKAGARIEFPEWLEDPDVLDAIEEEQYLFAESINGNSSDVLRDQLYEGMENGEGIRELTDRIEALYDGWEGYRAERIARTESARAYSNGHIAAWKSTGVVDNKVWVAAADACPFCLDMDGTVVSLDATFMDEGESQDIEWNGKDISLSQDYSDVKGPPLHPNCRCAIVGELSEEKMVRKGGPGSGNFGHGGRPGQGRETSGMPAELARLVPKLGIGYNLEYRPYKE